MFYLRDPKPLAIREEMSMYYEVVKYPAVGIAVCKHPVTRSALIKRGFTDITGAVCSAGGPDKFLMRAAGLPAPKPEPETEPETKPEKNPENQKLDEENKIPPAPEPEPEIAPIGPGPDFESQADISPEKTVLTYDEIKRMNKSEIIALAKIHGLEVGIDLPRFTLISEVWKAVKPCE